MTATGVISIKIAPLVSERPAPKTFETSLEPHRYTDAKIA